MEFTLIMSGDFSPLEALDFSAWILFSRIEPLSRALVRDGPQRRYSAASMFFFCKIGEKIRVNLPEALISSISISCGIISRQFFFPFQCSFILISLFWSLWEFQCWRDWSGQWIGLVSKQKEMRVREQRVVIELVGHELSILLNCYPRRRAKYVLIKF